MKFKKFALLMFITVMLAGFGFTATTETASAAKSTKVTKTTKKKNKKKTKKSKKKSKKAKYSKSDLRLLTSLIYAEAGNQSYQGKLAVGVVVMNRKRSSSFPNSVKGVIYQSYQFGPVRNGALNSALRLYDKGYFDKKAAYKDCKKAAKAALEGTTSVKVSGKTKNFSKIYFFNGWVSNAKYKIGDHMFK